MRAPSSRPIAALALAGALMAGCLSGCGKGSAAHSAQSSEATAPPAAHGVVGVSTKNTTRLGGRDAQSDAAAVAQAVYPGYTPATRPQAVVLVNEREWPAALAAAALASAPLGAPILYAEGNTLPEASERALIAMRPVGAASLGGAQVIRIGTTAPLPDNYKARTIPGSADRASVAVAVQRLLDSIRGKASHEAIVLASDAPQALQMPLAELAAESGTPILFVTSTAVPAATRKALEALEHPAIYVAAPTTLHASAYAALAHLGTVVHISGEAGSGEPAEARASSNPVENAISVSRFSHGAFGWGVHEAGHGLVFANVARPLDAPAAAPLAAHGDYGPLLLLEHSASVPSALTHYLSDIEPGYTSSVPPVREVYNHGWLIGDESMISALAQAEIDTVLEIAPRQASAGEQSVAEAE
jgi:ell wall binding domain 2 (CWB2)